MFISESGAQSRNLMKIDTYQLIELLIVRWNARQTQQFSQIYILLLQICEYILKLIKISGNKGFIMKYSLFINHKIECNRIKLRRLPKLLMTLLFNLILNNESHVTKWKCQELFQNKPIMVETIKTNAFTQNILIEVMLTLN